MSASTAIPAEPGWSVKALRLIDPYEGGRRWTLWETCALLLYATAVCAGIAQHVAWADEAQAWMLTGDVTLSHLLTHSLHYEGTPGLWHVLLMLLQLCHVSFTGMRWIAGAIAAAGVVVLLASAPFPRIIKLLLPLSFFLAYQDAVVARSYVLFAVLAFAAATLLRGARVRPWILALVLGLMAHVSMHGALASGGLAVVAIGVWRRRIAREDRLRTLCAGVVLIAFWLGAVATMTPAPDINFVAGNNVQRSIAKVEQRIGIRRAVPAPLSGERMANLPPTLPAVHVRHGLGSVWNKLVRTLAVITYPLSTFRALAFLLVVLVSLQAWFGRDQGAQRPGISTGGAEFQAGPIGLVPYFLMVGVFTSLYLAPRHAGMVFTTFVVSAWLTWPAEATARGGRRVLRRAIVFVFSLVLLVQISWTLHALRGEYTSIYSPDKETADYLKQRGVGAEGGDKPAAGFYYYSVGPLLYFDRNIYFNQPPHRYWYWSTEMLNYSTVEDVLARHPQFIVIGGYEDGPDAEITRDWQPNTPPMPGVVLGDGYRIGDYYRRNGYYETHVFCGHSWMRSSYAERICQTVLEPD